MSKLLVPLGLLTLLAYGCMSKVGGGESGGTNSGAGGYTGSTIPGGGKIKVSQEILDRMNASCAQASFEAAFKPALLEFVVDISSSMGDIPAGASASKWEITKAALEDAILNQLPDNTGVGLLMFPNMNTTANHNDQMNPIVKLPTNTCVNTTAMVSAGPLGAQGSAQRASVAAALQKAKVAGGTPTDDAFEYAYTNGLSPGLQSYGYYSPFMVLITDGQPSILLGCAGTGSSATPVSFAPIEKYIQDLNDPSVTQPIVKTFVVGSPGSEAQSSTGEDGRSWLSMAARLGGTSQTPDCADTGPNYCHFDVSKSANFARDFSDALKAIITAAIPCSVKIPVPSGTEAPDPSVLNVVYQQNVVNGTPTDQWLIGQTSDTSCGGDTGDGWYIDPSDATGTTIVLCPTTCDAVQADKYAVLQVRQGCKTITAIQ